MNKMTKGPGKGRGMLQIETFLPCRRPGQPRDTSIKPVNVTELINKEQKTEQGNLNGSLENGSSKTAFPIAPSADSNKCLIAKYNYQANLNRPGGFEEMSLTAGEKLTFIACHPVNPYWWEARKETGQVAFIPASYVMILEQKLTNLPWLEGKKAEKEKEENERAASQTTSFGAPATTKFKPYTSAYAKPSEKPQAEQLTNYFCEICNKQLNGIKPYQAHMVSKAHKDEVELAAAYNS